MHDGALRRGVKRVARWNFDANMRATRAWRRARRRPTFVLGGSCQGCGSCCEAPAIQVAWWTWYLPAVRATYLWWQRQVNGFHLVRRDVGSRTLVFRCTHFDAAARSCDSYASRPGICRDYPAVLMDQSDPQLLPGCGYRAVAGNAAELIRVLERASLRPAQREELSRTLRLK